MSSVSHFSFVLMQLNKQKSKDVIYIEKTRWSKKINDLDVVFDITKECEKFLQSENIFLTIHKGSNATHSNVPVYTALYYSLKNLLTYFDN